MGVLDGGGGRPTGTPYSLLRLPSGGSGQEASPITVAATGALVAQSFEATSPWIVQAESTTLGANFYMEGYSPVAARHGHLFPQKCRNDCGARAGHLPRGGAQYHGADHGAQRRRYGGCVSTVGIQQFQVESIDAQGRIGGFWRVQTSPVAAIPCSKRCGSRRQATCSWALTTFGTGLAKGVVIASGTPPTTSPPDAVQLWSADMWGNPGQASLHLRTEDGTSHLFGPLSGIGTLTPVHALDVVGAINASDKAGTRTNLGLGTIADAKRQ